MADHESPAVDHDDNISDHSDAWWWHDDGIFRYRKSLVWEPIQPVPQSAREVIEAFREREQMWRKEAAKRKRAWDALPKEKKAKPWVTEEPPPRARKFWERLTPLEIKAEEEYQRNLVEMRNRQVGHLQAAWGEVANLKANAENKDAPNYGAFPSPCEPDYSDLQTAGHYHETFCWVIALRNAFRIFDLFGIKDGGFPGLWSHVDCQPSHPSHASLVASASYQMGLYFAKAQAMQRVPLICRSLEMTRARKGSIKPFGETVMQACGEMHEMGTPLEGNRASRRVLEYLVGQGQAELNPPKIIGEDAPSGKINREINRFLVANRLKVSKTRSVKKVK